MIRFRSVTGDITELPDDVRFVEICDNNEDPAIVFFVDNQKLSEITPNTEESEFYSSKFNCKFSKLVDLGDRYEDNE